MHVKDFLRAAQIHIALAEIYYAKFLGERFDERRKQREKHHRRMHVRHRRSTNASSQSSRVDRMEPMNSSFLFRSDQYRMHLSTKIPSLMDIICRGKEEKVGFPSSKVTADFETISCFKVVIRYWWLTAIRYNQCHSTKLGQSNFTGLEANIQQSSFSIEDRTISYLQCCERLLADLSTCAKSDKSLVYAETCLDLPSRKGAYDAKKRQVSTKSCRNARKNEGTEDERERMMFSSITSRLVLSQKRRISERSRLSRLKSELTFHIGKLVTNLKRDDQNKSSTHEEKDVEDVSSKHEVNPHQSILNALKFYEKDLEIYGLLKECSEEFGSDRESVIEFDTHQTFHGVEAYVVAHRSFYKTFLGVPGKVKSTR